MHFLIVYWLVLKSGTVKSNIEKSKNLKNTCILVFFIFREETEPELSSMILNVMIYWIIIINKTKIPLINKNSIKLN